MKKIKYVSIPKEYADHVRKERKDQFGHFVEMSIAGEQGYGPCRVCLKQFLPGEKRLLLSYDPVKSENPYNEIGPVYIHERDCPPYELANEFPEEVKNGRLLIPLLLRCYNASKYLIDAVPVKSNEHVEQQISQVLENENVAFVHVRNAEYQCFIAQAERENG